MHTLKQNDKYIVLFYSSINPSRLNTKFGNNKENQITYFKKQSTLKNKLKGGV